MKRKEMNILRKYAKGRKQRGTRFNNCVAEAITFRTHFKSKSITELIEHWGIAHASGIRKLAGKAPITMRDLKIAADYLTPTQPTWLIDDAERIYKERYKT